MAMWLKAAAKVNRKKLGWEQGMRALWPVGTRALHTKKCWQAEVEAGALRPVSNNIGWKEEGMGTLNSPKAAP